MSLFTKRMELLTAIVLEKDSSKVVTAMIENGIMDFVPINEFHRVKDGQLKDHKAFVSRSLLTDLKTRCEFLFSLADIDNPNFDGLDLNTVEKPNVGEYKRVLDRLTESISQIREDQKYLSQKILTNGEFLRYIDGHRDEFLDIRIGSCDKAGDAAKRMAPFGYLIEKEAYNISLSLTRDSKKVSDILDKFNWIESEEIIHDDSVLALLKTEVLLKKDELEKDNDELNSKIDEIILAKADSLKTMWTSLRLNELCEYAQEYFSHTQNTTLFSGWIEQDKFEIAKAAIEKATNGNCILDTRRDKEIDREKVPVKITSPKICQPFEKMVNNFGTVEYGTVNPTIFTMISFMAMFTFMFADMGQGLVLLLLGLGLSYAYKKNPLKPDGLINRNIAKLLIYLGPASMLGGWLFGSFFGFDFIPALWFNFHHVVNGHSDGLVQSVYDILGITIKFGIIVIYVGLAINCINLARKKEFFTLLFDRNGFLGALFYTLGIYMGFFYVGSGYKVFPSATWFTSLLLFAVVALFLKCPLHLTIHAIKHKEKVNVSQFIMDTIMEFIVEALEIFSGYLSNTLSFLRVAGLGIAHVSLMTAFSTIADMVDNIFFKIAVLVFGNVLVIALEGLSAGIQSLRLNYYEFFSKYFTGRGIIFKPVGLKSNLGQNI